MSRVVDDHGHWRRGPRTPVDNSGGPPDDPSMEERVKKLEGLVEKTVERVVNIERDVAVMRSNYATGKEVSDAKTSIVMWVVAAIFLAQLLPMLKDYVRPSVEPASAAGTAPAQAAPPSVAAPAKR